MTNKTNKACDAYNAGWRSVERGDDGTEARYLRFRTGYPNEFNEGRRDRLIEGVECGAMFEDALGNACRCTRDRHDGLAGHRGTVVVERDA